MLQVSSSENTVAATNLMIDPSKMTSSIKNNPVKIPILYGDFSMSLYLRFPGWKET